MGVYLVWLILIVVMPAETIDIETQYSESDSNKDSETKSVERLRNENIEILKVTDLLSNLDDIRVKITNSGTETIYPKFDVLVSDSRGSTVCDGEAMEFNTYSLKGGESKTTEITLLGCMFNEDGTYSVKVDLLDKDYEKLSSDSRDLEITYWNQFDFGF